MNNYRVTFRLKSGYQMSCIIKENNEQVAMDKIERMADVEYVINVELLD